MIGYLLYAFTAFCTNLVSRSLGNWIACRVADCHYFFNKKSREGARSNLRVILGPDASDEYRQYMLRWTFRSFGKYFFEFLNNRRFNAAFFNRCVSFAGVHYLREAIAAGNGAVLISAHLGNWELGAAAMSYQGFPVLGIIQKHPNPRINRFYMRKREHRNYRVVNVGEAARPLLRHLKENGLVAMLADRPYGEEGIPVEFFGHQVPFPAGPARLALTAGAPLIAGFGLRRWDDSFRIFILPPIEPPEGVSKEEKVRHMTQAFARMLEKQVRECPSQWPTFYPVFEGSGRPEDRGF
jgi:KDO2-lipid IV(A) lauroyltransferase